MSANWFKMAKDFDSRNVINHKIFYLKSIKEKIEKLAKIVFQSAKTAKQTNMNIIDSKKVTSYPTLENILLEADSIVMDNPWKFSELCKEAIIKINHLISSLQEERRKITNNVEEKEFKIEKGLIYD